MDFSGKTAVITGASGGIGLAIARAMAKQGVDMVLADMNARELTTACMEIAKLGRKAVAVPCDVTGDQDVVNLAEKALKKLGKVDFLFNNAGVAVRGLVENMTLPDWEFIINTNLLGYIRNIQAFLPHMLSRGNGHIINISSIQALAPTGDILNIPYITTKAGILGLSESLYGYLKPKGISVTCVCPGAIATNMGANAHFVGSEDEKQKMKLREIEFFKMPFFTPPDVMAEELLKGMREEKYMIVIPADMSKRLPDQGRDVEKLNQYLKMKNFNT